MDPRQLINFINKNQRQFPRRDERPNQRKIYNNTRHQQSWQDDRQYEYRRNDDRFTSSQPSRPRPYDQPRPKPKPKTSKSSKLPTPDDLCEKQKFTNSEFFKIFKKDGDTWEMNIPLMKANIKNYEETLKKKMEECLKKMNAEEEETSDTGAGEG